MRVFVAINSSEEERVRLAAATSPLRQAGYPIRWVPTENIHLTLKFLGEVPQERVSEVSSAVDAAAAGIGPFDMTLQGAGAFPSPRRPNVVWVGIKANEQLAGLQAKIEAALESIGFPREDRRFSPHLTIGRAKRKGARPPEFQGFEDALARLSYEDTFRVSAVDVMMSHLMPGGAVYEVAHGSRLEP